MPSPLGHALGGAAVGLLVSGRRSGGLAYATAFALIACAPDLDLLTPRHSGVTHSIGLAATAGIVLWIASRDARFALAGAAAYGSHVLFDWLGRDTAPPFGIMALWPFTDAFYMSPVTPLPPVSRQYWLPGFWMHTLKVALVELLVFGGAFALVWVRRASSAPPPHDRRRGQTQV